MENLRFIKSDQIKEIIDNNSFIAVCGFVGIGVPE